MAVGVGMLSTIKKWIYGKKPLNVRGKSKPVMEWENQYRGCKRLWNGINDSSFNAHDIWSDGINIYYSYGSYQYVLDKFTSTWTSMTWEGLTSFDGSKVWRHGNKLFYSDGSSQYYTSPGSTQWSQQIWSYPRSGISLDGAYIWSDGDKYYYSNGETQLELVEEPDGRDVSRWIDHIWSEDGYIPEYGTAIWTDGNRIYYSYSNQYFFEKETNTWWQNEWKDVDNNTLNILYSRIWTDGNDVYVSTSSDNHYILNKDTSRWEPIVWPFNLQSKLLYAQYTWTDGDYVYYSYHSEHYVVCPFHKLSKEA